MAPEPSLQPYKSLYPDYELASVFLTCIKL